MLTRIVVILTTSLILTGCGAAIKGVSNSNLHAALPQQGAFAVQLLDGDPVVGKKIERIISYQVAKHGYTPTDKSPDLLVSFAFDVSPAGSVSSAYTTINQAPQTAYVYGNTVRLNPSYSTATTSVNTTRMYQKTIVVRITRAATGEKLWDGVVSENGWCNQIFVTAPQILSMMFEGFPREITNNQKVVTDGDDGTKELRRLFPPETNWGCQRT
jgi:hypothetical protein